jgi:hypothetical protein
MLLIVMCRVMCCDNQPVGDGLIVLTPRRPRSCQTQKVPSTMYHFNADCILVCIVAAFVSACLVRSTSINLLTEESVEGWR